MLRITSGEMQRQWGRIQDLAIVEPITVTCNGRDRVVVLSSNEYHRLKRRDRQVLTVAELNEADLGAILAAEPPAESARYDHELKNG